ncbi:hypothetical protein KY330_01575 [Candidatus Woesearchaeota archaeon]|nr:hypothetical protein [Candidatus Woesearchaeota archaeon]
MIFMAIVGFNFTKINVEKLQTLKGKIDIKNNVSIKDVAKQDLILGSNKQDALRFDFEYIASYNSDKKQNANIKLYGEVIFLDTQDKVKKLLETWKKSKKVEPLVMQQVMNTALTKSNIQALVLSRDVNLPPPIPLPRLNLSSEKAKKYVG